MNLTAPLLLLLSACVASGAKLPRDLWQLVSTINCAQPGVHPLKYSDYGCWCGLRGQGTPKDEVDKCCRTHDKCYEAARKTPGCTGLADHPYVIDYDFTCSNKRVTCSASNDKCQDTVCECDRVAAHCLASMPYNSEYQNLDPDVHCTN